ncbi:MAG: hypothetical protein M3357_19725 [Actinomycetota bacterium]|nr:hypothetical protein [Actinomycetota bacterium]
MTATATPMQPTLETGWLPTTPTGDTLLRRFVHNQADVNEILAGAADGRVERHDRVVLADAGSPVAFFNQALLTSPLLDSDDPVLDTVAGFFAGSDCPVTLLSVWPTPDLSARGWSLIGHPTFVVRAPSPVSCRHRPGVEVRLASEANGGADYVTAERIAIDGFPLDEAHGAAPGSVLPAGIAGHGLEVRLGSLDGEPVAVGNVFVAHGVANLCLAATLPKARRRGVWEALVRERVATAPDLPALAFTSDLSRPGFIRMGFLPILRFTLWSRPAA